MGLDMYAFMSATHPDEYVNNVTQIQQLHYWRKHPNLHGWMGRLYDERGGTDEFNCVKVNLTLEDLNRLEQDMKDGSLEKAEGFFFGESDAEDDISTIEFIEKARTALKGGSYVWYDSWW